MSFSHLSFSSASPLSSSQMAAAAAATTPSTPSAPRACCENGRPVMTDPHTGQTVCSCQYGSALLNYPRLSGLTPSNLFPPSPYPGPASSTGYMGLGSEGSAFYPLGSGTGRESSEAWRSLTQPAFSDYTAMSFYPYGPASYGGLDLNARRKNATRESTNTLKAWLQEHIKNPYPTKGEKIMLAIITKMTLTQVSTWFANARRRLKKENKMTWSPRNRSEDGEVNSQGEDNDDDGDDEEGEKATKAASGEGKDGGGDDVKEEEIDVGGDHPTDLTTVKVTSALTPPPPVTSGKGPALGALFPEDDCVSPVPSVGEDSRSRLSPPQSRDSDSTFSSEGLAPTDLEEGSSKPKIWSVTDFLHNASATAALKYDRADSALLGAHAQRSAPSDLGAMMGPPPTSATNYNSPLLASFPSSLGYTSHTYSSYFGSPPGPAAKMARPTPARFGPYPTPRPGLGEAAFPASRDIGSIREGE